MIFLKKVIKNSRIWIVSVLVVISVLFTSCVQTDIYDDAAIVETDAESSSIGTGENTDEGDGQTDTTQNADDTTGVVDDTSDASSSDTADTSDETGDTTTAPETEGHTHSYGEWIVTKSSTCKESGSRKKICSCGDFKTESIPALAHTEVTDAAVNAGCTTYGKTEGKHCSVCGTVIKAQVDVAPKGHSESDVLGKAPTDVESGLTTGKKCNVCGTTTLEQKVIPPYIESCNGDYVYNNLGTQSKGSAKQTLYTRIDTEAKAFHTDSSKNAQNDVAFTVQYQDLGLSEEEAVEVWLGYKNDNPLFYWISTSVSFGGGDLNVLTDSAYAQGSVRIQYNSKLYGKIAEFISAASNETSAYMIALAYHDAIIEAIDYVYEDDGITPKKDVWAHSIVGVFDGKGGVCEAYARAFQLLLNVSGIENIFVSGAAGFDENSREDHAWNLIKLDDGNWYWCDLTWDDIPHWEWGIRYNYFCVNDTQNVNWSDDYGFMEHRTFVDEHIAGQSVSAQINYSIDLPARSDKIFSSSDELVLRETFTVNGIKYLIVGYRAIQVVDVNVGGALVIPEKVTYKSDVYTVIAIGRLREDGLTGEGDFGLANTSVSIPKTLKFIWDRSLYGMNVEKYIVDDENPYFTDVDGVLFTKSLYTLIMYPTAAPKIDKYVIPDATGRVAKGAFLSLKNPFNELVIGKNVENFGYANWGLGYANEPITEGFGGNIIIGDLGMLMEHCSMHGGLVITVSPENPYIMVGEGYIYGQYEEVYCASSADITSVVIDDTMVDIHPNSFYFCKNLTKVTIPVSVICIESTAFNGGALEEIVYGGTMDQWNAIDKRDWWMVGGEGTRVVCTDGTIIL